MNDFNNVEHEGKWRSPLLLNVPLKREENNSDWHREDLFIAFTSGLIVGIAVFYLFTRFI